ncbi:MAG: hypothetical protein ACPG7E_04440 [Marinirhabdus sp.]
MKKLIALLLFATLGLATATVNAQSLNKDNNRPETIAKQRIAQLDKELQLDAAQERSLFRALVGHEIGMRRLAMDEADGPVKKTSKTELETKLEAAMKKTLTKAQFQKWIKIRKYQ